MTKKTNPARHFILAFLIAIVLYFVSFYGVEHLRTRHGPWRVAFTSEASVPVLVINEPQLGITNLKLTFPGQSAPATNVTMIFAQPQEVPFDVPFGQCLFEDTTFQPGTIAFQLFGHEIQLLPRTLTIDKKEISWQSDVALPIQ
jgi:hypothetical protein